MHSLARLYGWQRAYVTRGRQAGSWGWADDREMPKRGGWIRPRWPQGFWADRLL